MSVAAVASANDGSMCAIIQLPWACLGARVYISSEAELGTGESFEVAMSKASFAPVHVVEVGCCSAKHSPGGSIR